MDNERIGRSCKYIYTAFLSMLFAMIIILGIQYGFTILTVLSFLSLMLYIVCLVYVAKNKSYAYLLTAGMLNALTSFCGNAECCACQAAWDFRFICMDNCRI